MNNIDTYYLSIKNEDLHRDLGMEYVDKEMPKRKIIGIFQNKIRRTQILILCGIKNQDLYRDLGIEYVSKVESKIKIIKKKM